MDESKKKPSFFWKMFFSEEPCSNVTNICADVPRCRLNRDHLAVSYEGGKAVLVYIETNGNLKSAVCPLGLTSSEGEVPCTTAGCQPNRPVVREAIQPVPIGGLMWLARVLNSPENGNSKGQNERSSK